MEWTVKAWASFDFGWLCVLCGKCGAIIRGREPEPEKWTDRCARCNWQETKLHPLIRYEANGKAQLLCKGCRKKAKAEEAREKAALKAVRRAGMLTPPKVKQPMRVSFWLQGPMPEQALTVKARVRKRDGDRCRYCGRTDGILTFDHVMPKSRGGEDTEENLVLACVRCNLRKANRTPEEAGMPLLPLES